MSIHDLIINATDHQEFSLYGWMCIPFFFVALLCASSGTGGGPLYISLLVFANIPTKDAIPISKSVIFTGAFFLGFYNYSKKYPKKPRLSLIYWEMVFMFESVLLVGDTIGVTLNSVSPPLAIEIPMLILFAWTIYKQSIKIYSMIKKQKNAGKNVSSVSTEEPVPNEDHLSFNWLRWIIFVSQFAFVIGFEFLSINSWYVMLIKASIQSIYAVYFVLTFKKSTLAIYNCKEYPVWKIGLGGVFAGLCASYFGIGGGIVVTPIFMAMGLVPVCAAATSSCMIIYTAFSSFIQYFLSGRIPLHSMVLMCSTAVGFPLGGMIVKRLIARFNCDWLIPLCLVSVIAIGFVLIIVRMCIG